MTEEELEELLCDCPVLYHMAERGSWASIKERGLLSTSALLDLYGARQLHRDRIERQHRPRSLPLQGNNLPTAVIRDQKPMSDAGLQKCLRSGLSPSDWYQFLNGKCFFWLTEERLHKLTGAKAYRDSEHDVLEVDSRSLLSVHRDRIWLCHMNSGCTKPFPSPRDETVFAKIADYPHERWRLKRKRREHAAELAIDHSIRDIADHVRRVIVKKGTCVVSVIEER